MNETLKLENKTAKISEAQSPPIRLRKKTVLLFFFSKISYSNFETIIKARVKQTLVHK